MHRARMVVSHHQNVGPHRVEGHGGVDQRLALFDARRRDRHVHDVGSKPLTRKLERRLSARRRLEEQIDLRASAQGCALLLDLPRDRHRLIRKIEQRHNLLARHVLDAEEVTLGEDRRRRGDHCSADDSEPPPGIDLLKPFIAQTSRTAPPDLAPAAKQMKAHEGKTHFITFFYFCNRDFSMGYSGFKIQKSSRMPHVSRISHPVLCPVSPYRPAPAPTWPGLFRFKFSYGKSCSYVLEGSVHPFGLAVGPRVII